MVSKRTDLFSHHDRLRSFADGSCAVYHQSKVAEAAFIVKQKEAQAIIEMANAEYYQKKKDAEGMLEMAKGYGALAEVLGGPQGLLQYLMIQNNTYQNLATANAKAIAGLQPKITVWNTGMWFRNQSALVLCSETNPGDIE
jgi:flotillin